MIGQAATTPVLAAMVQDITRRADLDRELLAALVAQRIEAAHNPTRPPVLR